MSLREGDEVVDSARIVIEQAERMTALIRQLLDFAPANDGVEARALLGDLHLDAARDRDGLFADS